MRRGLLAVPALIVLGMPEQTVAQPTGGMAAPYSSGGTEYGQAPAPAPRRRPAPLVVRTFRVTPATITPDRTSARFSFRVDGGAPRVRVRFRLTRRGADVPAYSMVLRRRTGGTYTRSLRLHDRPLTPGRYVATLQVVDAFSDGGRLRARAASTALAVEVRAPRPKPPAPPAPPAPKPPATPEAGPSPRAGTGVFPVRGPYTFGGEGSRYGAARGDRRHGGQDIVAAEGTPLVAPRAGSVYWRAYQATGAGHYVVIRGDDGRDYVFMHMRAPSPLAVGDRVRPGAAIGEVGNTGSSSGAHLHFEIWPDGWYSSAASHPIDPLPELRGWAGA